VVVDVLREDVESDLIHAYPDLYSHNTDGLLVYKNGFNNPTYVVDIGVYFGGE
jgi:hypothetical protein